MDVIKNWYEVSLVYHTYRTKKDRLMQKLKQKKSLSSPESVTWRQSEKCDWIRMATSIAIATNDVNVR